MKHILAYGDSNTFGTKHIDDSERYDLQTRWTGLLATALGKGFRIIEEGLPGRTTAFNDPLKDYRSGRQYLTPCLNSHRPLDLVIVMLGTNELQVRYSASPADIANGLEILVDMIQKSGSGPAAGTPAILVISPPPIGTIAPEEAPCWTGAQEKVLELAKLYQRVAARYGCHFVNSHEILTIDDLSGDGFHLAESGHTKLRNHLAQRVVEILGTND